MAVRLALIAAVAHNGVIGRGGELPWRIPADLKYCCILVGSIALWTALSA